MRIQGKLVKTLAVAACLSFTMFLGAAQAHAATYYFDSVNGSDTNTGTSTASAWQHLSKLTSTTLNPGDTVYLLRGDTFVSNLVVNQSGTAGNPITYTAYGTGANPVINAMGNLHGVDIRNGKSYINISNIDVSNASNEEYLLLNGVSYINISNTNITGTTTNNNGFNLQTGTTTNITITNATSTISGTTGSDLIAQSGVFSNITITNYFASTTEANGVVFTPTSSSTNISIVNSTFNGHNSGGDGINFQGTGSNITIASTTMLYNASSGLFVAGTYNNLSLNNVTSSHNTTGWGAYFGGTTSSGPVTNVTVNNGDFEYNGQDGITYSGYGTYATTTNTLAQYNTNSGMNNHSFWTGLVFNHDTALNNMVNGFSFYDNTSGIISNSISRNNSKTAATAGSNSTAVFYNNLFSNNTPGTFALTVFSGGATGTVDNNVLYSPAQVGIAYQMQATSSVTFLNNVISGFATSTYNTSSGTFTNDYNDIYSAGLATSTYGTVVFGPHTINANPQFNNPSGLDFSLASTSPLINAGTTTPYTTDFLGNPRVGATDIGAYEYQPIVVAPPTVTSDGASSITATSALLNGTITNNNNATSTVRGFMFGTTTAYGIFTSVHVGTFGTGSFATSTSNYLTLTPNTTYHYAAYAVNSAGTTTASDSVFTTASTSAPVINAIATSSTQTTATISWTTTTASNSTVNYGTTSSYGTASTSPTLVTSHSITLTGLSPSTTYHFQVQSTDAFSNTATSSDQVFTTTSVPDTTPPTVTVTAPTSGATVSGASVTLSASSTDNVAVGGVTFYINGTKIGSEVTSSTTLFSTTWNSTATSSGSYAVTAVSRDTSNNYATSSPVSFTVSNSGPGISSIATSSTQTTATITWTTTTASNSTINYGPTTSYGTASTSAALVTSHSITLTGLSPSTTYHFQVQSTDGFSNTATSSDQTVTTAVTPTNATYYFDSVNGSDTNTGTSTASVWQHLSKLTTTTLNPGDTVYLLRGDTFNSNLVVNQSGTAGNPITYTAYGTGANPIINATGNLHGVDIRNGKSYINISNIDVSNGTNEEYFLDNGVSNINISNTTVTGTTTYNNGFNLTAGTSSNITITNATSTIAATSTSIGNDFDAQSGTFSNITFNNFYASTTEANGIVFTPTSSSTNISILNSTLNGHNSSGQGISLQGTGSNITIASTTLLHNGNNGLGVTGNYNNISVSNVTSWYNTNGWGLYFGGATAGAPVTNVTVNSSDLEYNGQDGILFDAYGANATTTNSLAQHNLNDGMDEHGYWTNVLFSHDTSAINGVDGQGANGDGFSIHDSTSGTFVDDIAHNNLKSGITNVGLSNTIAYNNLLSNDTAGTQAVMGFNQGATAIAYNNVIYSPAHIGQGFQISGSSTVTFMNNVIVGFATTTYDTSTGTFTNDYNDMFTNGVATSSSTYGTVVYGPHTINANPLFNNPGALDFSLQSSSPLINAGTTTPYTTDYLGNPRVGAPDIGAYEYQGTPTTISPPTVTSDGATSITATSSLLNGTITNNNNATSTVRGFMFGTTTAYGIFTSVHVGTFGTGSFATSTSNYLTLTPNTTYHYAAYAVNSAGTTTASDSVFTTASTSAPVINAIATSSTQTTATISWTTTTASNSTINYGPTTSYGTASTSAALVTSHSITLTGLSPSTTYHFQVQSTDAFSNTATSSDQVFTTTSVPDTTPPTVTVTAPTSGATVSGASVTLSASSTDNVAVGGVTFYINGTKIGSEVTSSTTLFSTTWNSTATSSGSYAVTAVSRDTSNNYATSSPVSFTVSNSGPGISSIATSSTQTTATITWTTTTASNSTINYGPTTSYGTASTSAALVTSHSITLTGLSPSTTYHFQVQSTDGFSNTATSSDQVVTTTATPDTTPPTVTLTSPAPSTVVSGSAYSLSAIAADNVAVQSVAFYLDNILLGTSTSSSSPYTYTFISTNVSDGAHTLAAVAKDTSSNYATSSPVSFTIDNTPPSRSAGSPSGTLALNTSSTTISLVTNEAATCKYSTTAGVSYSSMTNTFSTTGSTTQSQSITGLTNGGSYVYYVKCQDAVGNQDVNDYAISFSVAQDTTAPTVALTAPSNNAVVSRSLTITATASDDVAVTGLQFELDGTPLGAVQTSAPYTTTLDTTQIADGTHALSAVAHDGSGNYATSTIVSVRVDNTPPVLSTETAYPITTTGATITWNTDESATSQVVYGLSTSYGQSTTLDTNRVHPHSVALTGLTPSTLYHYAVISTDVAGNTSTSSDFTFTTNGTVGVNPPVISAITSNPSTTDATIAWSTDEAASSQIAYGTSSAYGSYSTYDPTLVTTHSQTLSNLSSGTTYHFAVISTDTYGNTSTSSDQILTTSSVSSGGGSSGGGGGGGGGGSSYSSSDSSLASAYNASNIAALQATLAGLIQQLEALGITPIGMSSSAGTTGTPVFTRDLTLGSTGTDVKALQQLLNNTGFTIASSGAGSPGNETTYFGAATQAAVIRMQKAYQITPSVGYFGAKTRAVLKAKGII